MQASSRILVVGTLASAVVLGACGGTAESPFVATDATATITETTGSTDSGTFTDSGRGPGPNPAASPGSGAGDCDGTGMGPGPGDGSCGTCVGLGSDPADIAALLGLALQEEYKAEMLYRSVLATFGADTLPFARIAEAEAQHVQALQTLFERRGIEVPASIWSPGSFTPFATVAFACAAGAAAETDDGAFYAPYLARTDLPQDVRNVFTHLQGASLENHRPAFELCR